jgi:hypothetical protein
VRADQEQRILVPAPEAIWPGCLNNLITNIRVPLPWAPMVQIARSEWRVAKGSQDISLTVILCAMWHWGGLVRQWSRLFFMLLGVGLAWEYQTHRTAALFVATIGAFIATVWFGLPRRQPGPDEVVYAAADLRREVKRIWEGRRVLLLNRAGDMNVSFDRVADFEDDGVQCPWQAGAIADIYDKYRDIPGGRLMILGAPGSGKTLLAITLVLEMITRGEQHAPSPSVPVPISVSGWDGVQDLGPWLVDRLVEGFRLSRAMAAELVERDYLLPVLDGLDETEPSPRDDNSISRMILEKLRNSPGANMGARPRPIVMTCRSDFYLDVNGRERLGNCVVVEARDIDRDAIDAYLRQQFKSDPAHSPFRSKLFANAISQPDNCLVTTLGRPVVPNVDILPPTYTGGWPRWPPRTETLVRWLLGCVPRTSGCWAGSTERAASIR